MQIEAPGSSNIGGEIMRRVALAVLATVAIAASACSSSTSPATSTTAPTTSSAAGPPTISSFKPASGPVGSTVTIKGTNLGGATKIAFNGVSTTATKDTSDKIKVKVPVGATTGTIEIVTSKGQAQTATAFTVG
jgi:ABC-type transport system substrate-binding protein